VIRSKNNKNEEIKAEEVEPIEYSITPERRIPS
jgi:hypothetical protein